MPTVISVEHLSKTYRLGQIGTGTFSRDLELWWAKLRGKPNPLLRIGETDHGNRAGEELWALRDVSFTVNQGEVLGIIGRNGAGKSTLLKILSRVTAPTSGRIRVKGRIASLLEVGTGFHPELTGRENIYLNGAILGMKRDEITRKFDEIVDFAEVEKFIDTPVKRYSSGMYVRLAFAVAAHLEPEILVVDEVLAVGDAEFQKKCLGKMGDVAKEGRTVLFVSHNMPSILALCTRCILLQSGTMISSGDASEIVTRYIQHASRVSSSVQLSHRTDRRGNGKLRFTKIEIQSSKKIVSHIFSGKPADILLHYQSSELKTLFNVKIAIVFIDSMGNRLFTCSNEFSESFQDAPHMGVIQCNIDQFPLIPGEYQLLVWSSVGDDMADRIENAASISVEPGNFFGFGKLPNPTRHGLFLVAHQWSVFPDLSI